ncbi:peptide-methionine (S)-S-oxide reductase MsrA [Thalassomonas sp. M1454]|uniref:peptide-methionine (S)-S-oxide reductase MsrA n=1 Tax=Thalassomonas sp. M1454 TaxID=2594477 RepID=UPI00163D7CA7|nr:peptide-methionine (S)-S-oxide reductase MsrA [Thalassomonas sp. M1454]
MQTAILGGGCFWCLEAPYQRVKGVISVVSGYIGGHVDNPTYQQICSGTSGHAEVVKIEFEPSVISFSELLDVFFNIHDPTQLNRQGNDSGTQYRSAIFYQDEQQQQLAQQYILQLSKQQVWSQPIVTTLEPKQTFYPAEDFHQNYYDNNPNQPYCQIMISPKLAKLEHLFADKLK